MIKWADYLIPVKKSSAAKHFFFGESITLYDGEPTFTLPESTKVVIIGIPEDRFSDGAGEIKSPEAIRKQLYALCSGSQGTVVDMGNLRTGKTLADTYIGLSDLVSEFYRKKIITLLIGGTNDLFYGNYLAMKDEKAVLTNIAPQLIFSSYGAHEHPLNAILFDMSGIPLQMCNIGYQSYNVTQEESDYFADRHFEAYRLGEARDGNLRTCEPIIRDSDLVSISMDAVKFSDAPAASHPSPNGFYGEEICQIAFFAGLSHKCRSLGLFDMIPHNDTHDITAKLAAQIIWYFIEGVKKRYDDYPIDDDQNFKKYLIYFDELHHNLCFFKNIRTERWWMEVPSIADKKNNLILSCTPEDYLRASEQEIPERWWKTYQRIN